MIKEEDYLKVFPYLLTYMSSKAKSFKGFMDTRGYGSSYGKHTARINKFLSDKLKVENASIRYIKKMPISQDVLQAIKLLAEQENEYSRLLYDNIFIRNLGLSKSDIVTYILDEKQLDFLNGDMQELGKEIDGMGHVDEEETLEEGCDLDIDLTGIEVEVDDDGVDDLKSPAVEEEEIVEKNSIKMEINNCNILKKTEFSGNEATFEVGGFYVEVKLIKRSFIDEKKAELKEVAMKQLNDHLNSMSPEQIMDSFKAMQDFNEMSGSM